MGKLILVRGIPGSGKSTIGRQIADADQSYVHYEADMFFMQKDGTYAWRADQIKEAHAWCQANVKQAMQDEMNVVVTNTFTRLWEMDAYILMAEQYGYEVEIQVATGNYQNIHQVPEEQVRRMQERFEYA